MVVMVVEVMEVEVMQVEVIEGGDDKLGEIGD